MNTTILLAGIVTIAVPLALVLYIVAVEALTNTLPIKTQPLIRPWLWLMPALLLLGIFLVYPVVRTIIDSFYNATSSQFVGLSNYSYIFSDTSTQGSMLNNLYWIIFFTGLSVAIGLMMAILSDKVRYGGFSKTLMFMPMVISYVAAGVIWRFVYAFRPPGSPQTGTLNAIGSAFGASPIAWLIDPLTNNASLIFVGVWTAAGFCMVILSAGLRGLPEEVLEAARVDGATEWQVFARVTMPLLLPTIAVVATTMIINALKVFDIVYVMTSGNFNTDVIANQMYKQLFISRDIGRASAIAVVLLIAVLPVMLLNIQRFKAQENR